MDNKFALIVTSHGNSLTKEGETFWVTYDDDEHWVSSTRCSDPDRVPGYVFTFNTREGAEAWVKEWDGHPWWCQPNGQFEIVEIAANMVTVQKGWKRHG